jgi:AraC-like DNA-binding protein
MRDHVHRPRPLDAFDEHSILVAVFHYFSIHYREPITIPALSKQLGISLLHIEIAFDLYKGSTANQALLEYRLNRLCDLMHRDPAAEISVQISQCGLGSAENAVLADFQRTNQQFMASFGISLVAYHQQCCLAQVARLQRHRTEVDQQDEEQIGGSTQSNRLLTRFHQSA